ncbi:MAG: DNA-binding transcriptional regulator Fis [Flavobacteriaceae bacterium]|jgi:Fis family transcriptional regulator|nr:DNA-binding transcriptional regulator Fis [Flavobacteriaceae bacterium]|tara:strand:+ start:2874 stop:3119 length:246 start_codon:yes stop_codon:yes gene_type:complete
MVSNEEKKTLRYQVGIALRRYFKELDGSKASDVFQMVMTEVEGPMLEEVLKHCKGNQSEACKILGINRGTLRTKLKNHKLI